MSTDRYSIDFEWYHSGMAGHSKWNNIKNRKGAVDDQRSKIFGQISKLIRIAVKLGKSGDPKSNASLRTVLEKARAANMPNDKIQRAIERGVGRSSAGAQIQEIVYEGFGVAGVGFLVVVHTDNPVRSSAELKFIFSRNQGSMGSPGSAQYLFERKEDEFVVTMPTPVDATQKEILQQLVTALRENEDVEDVFYTAQLDDENV
jgi:YebC/PmpR family DNA-binding regulatory protein